MLLARYRTAGGSVAYGALAGEEIHPLAGDFPTLSSVAGAAVRLTEVTLLTPTVPTKVISLGPCQRATFRDRPLPERPTIWFKPAPSCLTDPGAPVVFPQLAPSLTYEAEIALVIGRAAHRVSVEEASVCIAGYTAHNDLTGGTPGVDRDTPLGYHWKSFDGLAVLGPVLATHLTSADLDGLAVRAWVNGELSTDGVCELLFAPDYLVSWLSHVFTLYPGDVISLGAVGYGPLEPRDVVEIDVEGIGSIETTEILPSGSVVAPAQAAAGPASG